MYQNTVIGMTGMHGGIDYGVTLPALKDIDCGVEGIALDSSRRCSSFWVKDSRHWPSSGNHTYGTFHICQLVVQLPPLLAYLQVAILH